MSSRCHAKTCKSGIRIGQTGHFSPNSHSVKMGQNCSRIPGSFHESKWKTVDVEDDFVYFTNSEYNATRNIRSHEGQKDACGAMPSLKRKIKSGFSCICRLLQSLNFFFLVIPVKFMMELLLSLYEPLLKNAPIYTPTILQSLLWIFKTISVYLFKFVIPLLFDLSYLILTSSYRAISEYGIPFLTDVWENVLFPNEEYSIGNKFSRKKTFNDTWSEADIKGLTRFSENFEALLQSDHLSDCTISVRNTKIKIHRPILAARSPVFSSMLEADETSEKSKVLTIADCNPEDFKDFLHYLYTGKTERIRTENVIELFVMADRYVVPLLKEECIHFLKDNIFVDNVCDVLSAGLRLDETRLIFMAGRYFLSNTKEILRTVKWQTFLVENTNIANELIRASLSISPGNEITCNVNETNKSSVKNMEYKHLINLSESIEALFLSDHFSDFTIKVSDREFKVHKAVIASQSAVLGSMQLHEMKESITGILEVSDCDSDVFEDFLYYLYSGRTEKIFKMNAAFLYRIADIYGVCKLKEECGRFMKENISVECFCDVMALAMVHRDTELIEIAMNYFISNTQEIISSDNWNLFSSENPTVANELYIKKAESLTET